MWQNIAFAGGVVIAGFAVWGLSARRTIPRERNKFCVSITNGWIICKDRNGLSQQIAIDSIKRITLVTNSAGPSAPDAWFVFEGESSECSVPWEAEGCDIIFNLFKTKFPGLDYESVINAGTTEDNKVLWSKDSPHQTARSNDKVTIYHPDAAPIDAPDQPPAPAQDTVLIRRNISGRLIQEVFGRSNKTFGFRYQAWVNFVDAGGNPHHLWHEYYPQSNVFTDTSSSAQEQAESHAAAANAEFGVWTATKASAAT